ncbi:ABC transporter ATP-binding protein [Neoactinobaculum massilliense]|uniref:ABC transporter ATP-binding protein n=1 Tax=Neoactinobaculum massilliense TaxID=2364794 RepID=UPI0013DE3BAF|nr:ATP-binding cassette domain-containing protein [Neoactinobaculum massilliense]
MKPALEVRGLEVRFGAHRVIHDGNLTVYPGEVVGLVGSSGAGKSVTARTLLGLTGEGARVRAEHLIYRWDDGEADMAAASDRRWRAVRGRRVGMIMQDALVGLDPLRTIGAEISEALGAAYRGDRRKRAVELLETAGLPGGVTFLDRRADEMSGGQRQRALVAAAVAQDPPVIIADEPTASLDPVTRDAELDLLTGLAERGRAILLISHDLEGVSRVAHRVYELKDGTIAAPVEDVRATHLGRQLAAFLAETPVRERGSVVENDVVLRAQHVTRTFNGRRGEVRAVDDASFKLRRGETLGLVGESGSGKSTLARIVLGLLSPNAGSVEFLGTPWVPGRERVRRDRRGRMGYIPQDALTSFDPRRTCGEILADALSGGRVRRPGALGSEIAASLDEVNLPASVADRRPIYLSGGQRQRLAIARALAARPDVLVCDEAVSALDPGTRTQVLGVLERVQQARGLAMLFISHDPQVTARMADRIVRMDRGVLTEAK